jgi:hypothetical protein
MQAPKKRRQADHAFLNDIFPVGADQEETLGLDAHEILVLVEQELHRQIIAALCEQATILYRELVDEARGNAIGEGQSTLAVHERLERRLRETLAADELATLLEHGAHLDADDAIALAMPHEDLRT